MFQTHKNIDGSKEMVLTINVLSRKDFEEFKEVMVQLGLGNPFTTKKPPTYLTGYNWIAFTYREINDKKYTHALYSKKIIFATDTLFEWNKEEFIRSWVLEKLK